MKVSNIGLKSCRINNLDSQFPVQDMLLQTGQVEQFSSGIYAYGHIPFLVKNKINTIIVDVLTKYDCSYINLPLLQPENIWIKSGRLEKYVCEDVMFRCLTDKGNYCLAPTAEEASVVFASSRLMSYKNLPVTFFQIGEKFRNEIRTRGYLLRGKSFEMMDVYSFGKNKDELDKQYDKMKKAYMEIFNQIGLDVHPVGADSGAIGGAKSEEFMCISDIGEDNILYDKNTGKLINSELLEREDASKYIEETYGIKSLDNLETKKACELGHIFELEDKYSKSMNATYINENGKEEYYSMGCYGIGVSRTLALVYENSIVKDDNDKFNGISLPINLSPYLIYLIVKTDDKDKLDFATWLYDKLISKSIKVLYDDRDYMSIGAKIKDSKITGVPYLCVLGNTIDDGYLTVENNKTHVKIDIKVADFVKCLSRLEEEKDNLKTLEEIVNEL